MTSLPFIKMHGAGNDYVFVDGFDTPLPRNPHELAIQISNRHFAVGSDGLVFLKPPPDSDSDVQMRMWNADGSEGLMCGNAARCIALWMHRKKRVRKLCRIRTATGVVRATILEADRYHNVACVSVNLQPPAFRSEDASSLPDLKLPNSNNSGLTFTGVNVGNPHAVVFVPELSDQLVHILGPQVATHPEFPAGVNVEWVSVKSPQILEVRVWERGSGETLACGSGACAAVAAAVKHGFCRRGSPVQVRLPGGILSVVWPEDSDAGPAELQLIGPATVSFLGEWQLSRR